MLDEERITNRIAVITDNLRELKEIRDTSLEDFLSDKQKIAAAKYFLQTSIEAIVDIGNHIIARLRFGVPENNFQTFELLVQNKVLDRDKLSTYRQMVKFRNLVVHLYHTVDDERVYQILQENLDDFEDFISKIVSYRANSAGVKPQNTN